MKKKKNEFDTSFLNDVQEFEDINSDDVFSFDSSTDNDVEKENIENSSLLSKDDTNNNVDFEFPADFSFEDVLPSASNNQQEDKTNDVDDVSLSEDKSDISEIDGVSNVDFEFPLDFNFDNVASTAEEKVEEPMVDVPKTDISEDDGFKSFDEEEEKTASEDASKLSFQPIPGITDNVKNNGDGDSDNIVEAKADIPFIAPEEIIDDKSVSPEEQSIEDVQDDPKKDIDEQVVDNEESVDSKEEDDFESKLEALAQNTDFDKKDVDVDVDTDINNLFVKVNSNVKEASDIFLKNVEMKKKIDERFNELKQLQSSVEEAKKHDYDEINEYKDKVIKELMEKKEEIEERLNTLKELQSTFEKERDEFEDYKRDENIKIEDSRREAEASFESHKEELDKLEDKLRKQKTALEEERRQLSLDQIQYESDKNELANNMLKFNEIVGTFTNGMDKLS